MTDGTKEALVEGIIGAVLVGFGIAGTAYCIGRVSGYNKCVKNVHNTVQSLGDVYPDRKCVAYALDNGDVGFKMEKLIAENN